MRGSAVWLACSCGVGVVANRSLLEHDSTRISQQPTLPAQTCCWMAAPPHSHTSATRPCVQWGANGISLRGQLFPLVRIHFMTQTGKAQ